MNVLHCAGENVLLNPLKPKLVYIVVTNTVRTAKKTQPFTVTQIKRLTLFKEIIAVYSENHTKHTNTLCRQNLVYLKNLVRIVIVAL
jgi:hypothetical protein